ANCRHACHDTDATSAVESVMSRDALDVLRQQIVWRQNAHISERKHADHPLTLVDHRQPADPEPLHVPYRFGKIVIFAAAMDAWRHHVPRDRALHIETILRQTFANDVTVGDHADQPVILSDRNGANVVRAHQFGEFDDRGIRADPLNTLVHCFFDFHADLLAGVPHRSLGALIPSNRGVFTILAVGRPVWVSPDHSMTSWRVPAAAAVLSSRGFWRSGR